MEKPRAQASTVEPPRGGAAAAVEAELAAYEDELRARRGLPPRQVRHFRRPHERPFTAEERAHTTILFGGLTVCHESLMQAAVESLGYRVELLPTPDNQALAVGKEYGNRGQCNPTYYTVGNLVKYLLDLRAQGVEDVASRYVFVTAGSCGPCRFGMYEGEYRKALHDAGLGDLRVIIFSQSGGLNQSGAGNGLEMGPPLFIALIRAVMLGDLLGGLAHQIRPYELMPGATDETLEYAYREVGNALRTHASAWRILRRVRRRFEQIEVDYTRVKPKVQIIGEFWAMTTEGDGNYHLARWLRQEGAEPVTEPVSTWLDYLMWSGQQKCRDRQKIARRMRRLRYGLRLAQAVYHAFYTFYRWGLGFLPARLPSQQTLARYAHGYYSTRLKGGEGHLEVGKTIMSTVHKKSHLVISVKPFGCMPSTQSDGVQSKVLSDFPDALFVALETSGDSEVNFKSRAQMKLYEAKQRARDEVDVALARHGITMAQVRAVQAADPRLRRAGLRLPTAGTATAVRFIALVARRARRVAPASTAGQDDTDGRTSQGPVATR